MAYDNYTTVSPLVIGAGISPNVIGGGLAPRTGVAAPVAPVAKPAAGASNKDYGPLPTLGGGGSSGGAKGSSTTTLGSGGSGGGGTAGGSTSTTESNSTTRTSSTDITETISRVQNMDDASLAALNRLIADLENGGTKEMLADRVNRLAAIASAQGQQEAYSKEAAFADARGAMDQQTRQVMETLLPSLTRSAEGAGSSRNSMRALLEQQGAQRAAESASAIGLKAATDYGQVQNGISSILAQLVALKDPAADALLAALGIAKGAVVTGNTRTVATHEGVSNTTGSSTTNTVNHAPAGGPIGVTPGTLFGGGQSGGMGFTQPAAVAPPVQGMYAYGNFNNTNNSGLGGLSYGTSGQTIGDYLGLGGNFADQFTFGPGGN